MNIIAIVLVCLACACHGRRLYLKGERTHDNRNAGSQNLHELVGVMYGHHRHVESSPSSSKRHLAQASPVQALAARLLEQSSPVAGYQVTGSAQSHATAQTRPVHRLRPVLASESSSDDSQEEEEAERKRIKAERLALEAERAALQAEELELKMARLRLQQAKNQAVEEAPTAAPAPPMPANTAAVKDVPAPAAAEVAPSPAPFPAFNASEQKLPLAGPVSDFAKLFGFSPNGSDQQLSDEQAALAKEKVFDLNSFYVTGVEQTMIGTVFRGSMRSNSSVVFDRVSSRAAETPELQDFKFMLMEDPVPPNPGEQMRPERDPVFIAINKKNTDRDQVVPELIVTIASFVISTLSSLGYSWSTYLLADGSNFMKAFELGDRTPFEVAFPVAVGIGALQLVHEAGHLSAATKYGLKTSLPTYLPSLQLGTFGCITKLLAFPTNRTALFDFALAGPALGGGISLILYLAGLLFSQNLPLPPVTTQAEAGQLVASIGDAMSKGIAATTDAGSVYVPPSTLNPVAPVSFLRSSWLLGSLANILLPATTSSFVSLHPLALIGFCGVLINALNLIPAGRLDGGRMATAVIGARPANVLTGFSLLLLALQSLFNGDNPIFFAFGIYIILFQRLPENPCLDELTPVDENRQRIAGLAAVLALLVLVPLPFAPPPTSGVGGFM